MRRDLFSTSVARPPTHTDAARMAPLLVPVALKPRHTPAGPGGAGRWEGGGGGGQGGGLSCPGVRPPPRGPSRVCGAGEHDPREQGGEGKGREGGGQGGEAL